MEHARLVEKFSAVPADISAPGKVLLIALPKFNKRYKEQAEKGMQGYKGEYLLIDGNFDQRERWMRLAKEYPDTSRYRYHIEASQVTNEFGRLY